MSNPDFDLAESISTTNPTYFIVVYILVLIYCCFGLAIVCDVYFVPALQKLSYTYDLPPDIAGSTLMALGASVPELFASLIGVFVTEDDIGTGSIIGSSCFNLIAVPAACAFVASASFTRKLTISPMPVIRNSAFYAITILVLLLIIKDNKVDIPEACILLLFFAMYMGFMIYSAQSSRRDQHRRHADVSKQSSLTSSYISTDSAIAECSAKGLLRPSAKQCTATITPFGLNGGGGPETLMEQQQYHYNQLSLLPSQPPLASMALTMDNPICGQFYFANTHQGASNILNSHYYSQNSLAAVAAAAVSDEKTPLVGCNNYKSCEQLDGGYGSGRRDLHRSQSSPHDQSVSIDLGIAIKNSSCLVKNNNNNADHLVAADSDANKKFMSSISSLTGGAGNGEHGEDSWISSNWILVPMFPLTLSLKVLTPLKFKNTCWTIWTFLVSITLIGALTYVSVSMVHLFGQALDIPETVAGMTILSWGTGIPELIASIVLIKKTAQADMAFCNTIGSNVIDASFCLSLPWIVKCLLNRAAGLKPEVDIQSASLPWTSFTLLLSLMLLIIILKLHNWELSVSVGVWLMLTYVAFVAAATYLESCHSKNGIDLLSMF